MKRAVRLVFFLIVLAFGLFFGLLNAGPVHVDYYFGARDLPLSLVLILALVVGALCGVLAGLGQYLRLRREIYRLRKDVRNAERETTRSRAFAAKDGR